MNKDAQCELCAWSEVVRNEVKTKNEDKAY